MSPYFLGFSTVVVAVYLVRTVLKAVRHVRLLRAGVTGEAVVIDHRVIWDKKPFASGRGYISGYRIRYRYHHRNKRYEREASLNKEDFQKWTKGTQLPIRYLPQHPQTAELEALDLSIPGTIVRIAGLVLLLGILIYITFFWRI